MDAIVFSVSAIFLGLVGAIAAAIAIRMVLKRTRRAPQPVAPPAGPLQFDAPAPVVAPEPPPPRPSVRRPPDPARIEAFLFAPDAPSQLLFPLHVTKGRILEINLPLVIRSTGGHDAEDIVAEVTLPNEITFGASLERMAGAAHPKHGLRASYALAGRRTAIAFRVDGLAAGQDLVAAVPISVKSGIEGAFRLSLAASFAGGPSPPRDYQLELIDLRPRRAGDDGASAPIAQALAARLPDAVGAWICTPDEASRVRETGQPIDRIASTRFDIRKPQKRSAHA